MPLDTWLSPDGTAAFTTGVYVAVAGVPFEFLACTVAGTGVPVNPGFGVKVTLPVAGSIVYLPTFSPAAFLASISVPSIGWFVVGSTNFAGFDSLIVIVTLSCPDVKVGVPDCGAPWIPSEPTLVPCGVTSVTVGV